MIRLSLLASLLASAVSAQTYPTKPVRMLSPNAPGSSNDVIGRILANRMGDAIGQQVVVDNRAGAGGVIGMEIGKNATPDGYTLVSASTAAMSIGPNVYRKVPYDPHKDFIFVTMYAMTPNALVVHPSLPVKTVRELIEHAKAKGGSLNMASAGAGSQSHLTGAMLMQAAGIPSVHVPYKGGGPSVASVVANESQWTITPAPATMGMIKAGRLRLVAHSLTEKHPMFGDAPTIDSTIPGFKYSGWIGMLLPNNTPPAAVVNRVRAEIAKVVAQSETKEMFLAQGAVAMNVTGDEFKRHFADEFQAVAKAVKAGGIKVE